jgi:hypothetical protein
VLCKPQRPNYSDLGAWRPIALLSIVGKIIETVIACWLSDLVEWEKLLLDT